MTICHLPERAVRDRVAVVHQGDAGSGPLRWRVTGPADIPTAVRERWEALVDASDHPFGLYRSPRYFDHLAAVDGSSLRLAYARDSNGVIAAVVPYQVERRGVSLHVARRYRLCTPPAALVTILGGEPLMPMNGPAIAGFVEAVLGRAAGAFGLQGIDERSTFLRLLTEGGQGGEDFLHERRMGLDRIDLIALPSTFAEFLGRYSSKKRYNLRRQERLLRERAGGDCELVPIEEPWQVPGLVAAIARMRQPVDAADASRYEDLASRGLLLGFVLMAAGQPIAGIIGKCHGSTYLIDRTTYDASWGELSPGATLLHLAIEDLIETRGMERINLGYGSPKGDYPETNERPAYRCSWLIRRSWASCGLWSLREWLRDKAAAYRWASQGVKPADRVGAFRGWIQRRFDQGKSDQLNAPNTQRLMMDSRVVVRR